MRSTTKKLQWKIAIYILESLLFPYRFFNAIALLIHETGHGLALYITTRNPKFLDIRNILTQNEINIILTSLIPFQSLPQYSAHPVKISKPNCTANQCRFIALSGITLNLLNITGAIELSSILQNHNTNPLNHALPLQLLLTYFIISNAIAMLSIPDIVAFIKGHTEYFSCGPAFAIRYQIDVEKSSSNLASHRLLALTEILAREAATRGGQSGGFSYIAKKSTSLSIIFDKVVKGKREDIVKILCQRLAELLRKAKKRRLHQTR